MAIIKYNSDLLIDKLTIKEKQFLKKKFSEKENILKEVKVIEIDTQKSKYYLLMMIQRLENIEYDLDHWQYKPLKLEDKI